jgi:type I restriction enzyme, S subunit
LTGLYIERVGNGPRNRALINSTQVKAMPVPVPPVEERGRLLGPIRAVRVRRAELERRIDELRTVQRAVAEDLLGDRTPASAA